MLRPLLLLCTLATLASGASAQSTDDKRGPLWGTIGFGPGVLYIGDDLLTAAAEFSAGVVLPFEFRLGAQSLHMRTMNVFSDFAGFSTHTLLAVVSRPFFDLAAVSIGFGRMATRSLDSDRVGRNSVMQVGGEFWIPNRSTLAARIFALRTWSLGTAKVGDEPYALGNPSQLQIGIGLRVH